MSFSYNLNLPLQVMAGIYIHIPFCKQACVYCNFHFSTSVKLKNDFIQALLKEISLRNDYLQGEIIETIYLGGGTPSLLTISELKSILDEIESRFHIDACAEVTMEANPDDISISKLIAWKEIGINRLSVGVQSFFEEDLQWMNRAHSAAQSVHCIQMIKDAGFTNYTIDLIYGTPGLNDEKWKSNVDRAIEMQIPHLSCYALTVEPRTALANQVKTRSTVVNVDDQAKQFLLLIDWMNANGYEQYEISNFSKPGMRSRHNSSYWQQKKYLGLGPSAHSFNLASRQWNVANNALYISSMINSQPAFEIENLTIKERINEYIMTSLRTVEGMDLEYIRNEYGEVVASALNDNAIKYQLNGNMQKKGTRMFLTRQGKLLADGIAADLFFTDV
jgi:oxygen-independent coproporphyrinogen-3 oxidase